MDSRQTYQLQYNKHGVRLPVPPQFVVPGVGNSVGVKDRVGRAAAQSTQNPISPSGNVQNSNSVGYDSGVGWWIGFDKGIPKLFIGNSASNKLTWDGERLTINGDFIIGQLSITANPGDDLQADIDLLTASGGGTLYLTTGTFNVDYNIVMTSNVRIIGVGSGGSVIDFGGGAFQIQAVGTLGNEIVSPYLQGFTASNSSIDLVVVDYAINFGCNDLTCDTGAIGLKLTNTTTANVYSSLQTNCETGLVAQDSQLFTIFSTNQINCTVNGGVLLTNVTNSTSIGCSVDATTGIGYLFDGCSNFGMEDFSITNITGIGINFDTSSSGIGVIDGFIDTCSSDGILIEGNSSTLQIAAANTISNNGGYGVNIDTGSTDLLIVANTFSSNTSGAVNDNGTGTLIRSNIGVADN